MKTSKEGNFKAMQFSDSKNGKYWNIGDIDNIRICTVMPKRQCVEFNTTAIAFDEMIELFTFIEELKSCND